MRRNRVGRIGHAEFLKNIGGFLHYLRIGLRPEKDSCFHVLRLSHKGAEGQGVKITSRHFLYYSFLRLPASFLFSFFLLYYKLTMNFEIELEQETDDRWIAEIPELPGVLAYGVTPLQAGARAKALALRVLAER